MRIKKMVAVLTAAMLVMVMACVNALSEEQTLVLADEVSAEASISPEETAIPEVERAHLDEVITETHEFTEETELAEDDRVVFPMIEADVTPEPDQAEEATENPDELIAETHEPADEIDHAAGEPIISPVIELEISIEGGELVEGALVTITANITGIPEGVEYSLQWSNDISGEMLAVEGETGGQITFAADALNTSCIWQIELTLIEAELPIESVN